MNNASPGTVGKGELKGISWICGGLLNRLELSLPPNTISISAQLCVSLVWALSPILPFSLSLSLLPCSNKTAINCSQSLHLPLPFPPLSTVTKKANIRMPMPKPKPVNAGGQIKHNCKTNWQTRIGGNPGQPTKGQQAFAHRIPKWKYLLSL